MCKLKKNTPISNLNRNFTFENQKINDEDQDSYVVFIVFCCRD